MSDQYLALMQSCIRPPFQYVRALSHEEISKLNCAWGMQNALPDPWPLGRNRRLERVANGR